MGSPLAPCFDHRVDSDRHERSAGAHRRATAEGLEGTQALQLRAAQDRREALWLDRRGAAAAGLSLAAACGPRDGAGVRAASERLQPCAGDAAGGRLDVRLLSMSSYF